MKIKNASFQRHPLSAAIVLGFTGLLPLLAAAQSNPAPDEVVISAQKRTERLKDTPVSASVLSEDALVKVNAADISDINNLVPSVQLKGTFNGRVPYAMRGISTNANEATIGLTSGVSIMIDGVPVPSDSMSANELQDIRRVEVLKGPQSTLGGRTASAGVINFITNAPSKTLQGQAGVTFTNDHERRVNALISGPVNESLSFSLSAYDNHRQYPIQNLYNGEYSHSDSQGARLKLALKVDRDTDVTLAMRTADSKSKGGTFTYQYLTPGVQLFPYLPWNGGNGLTQAQAFPGVTIGPGNTKYNSPVAMSSKVRDNDASLNIEHRVGGYTFTSTTATQREVRNDVQDVTAQATYFLNALSANVPVPPFDNTQHIDVTPKSFTQEFKIASPLDQFMSYVAGVFYSDVTVDQVTRREMFVNPKNENVTSKTKTTGIYGRATWNLTPATSLLTGLRYNRDQISYVLDKLDLGLAPQFSSRNSDTSSVMVGDLTLRQKLDKDNMVYGTYSRGYKPKAFNTAKNLTSNDPLAPADREDIDHLEAGLKGAANGGKFNYSLAMFNTTYKNFQVQLFPTSGGVINDPELSNAAKARTRGLEADLSLAATPVTRVGLSAALIEAKFLSFNGAPAFPGQTPGQGAVLAGFDANGAPVFKQDLSGKSLPDAPKVKLTLNLDHRIPGAIQGWDLGLNAQYAYRSSANFQANQNPMTLQNGFGLLNLGASFSSTDGKYVLSTFVNNVTNKFYMVNAEDFFSGLYATPGTFAPANAVIGQPARDAHRYVGMRFNVYFD